MIGNTSPGDNNLKVFLFDKSVSVYSSRSICSSIPLETLLLIFSLTSNGNTKPPSTALR